MPFPRFVRTGQPQTPVGANYPGLIYTWMPATDTLSKSGTITRAHTSNGVAVVTAASAYEYMNSAPQFSLDACSILSILTPADVTIATTYAVSCGSSANANPLFLIGQGASSGQLSFRTRDSANTDYQTSGTSAEWASGKTSVCVGVRSKSLATQVVYANGKQVASTAVGTAAATTFDRLAIGCLLRSSAALYWSGKTSLAAIFNRALSDAEIKSLSENPWQIFQPAARAIWVPVGAASAPEVSGALTTDDSTVSASASVSPVATASITAADATFTGTAGSPSEVSGAITTDSSTVSASAYVSPVATASVTTADSTFSGDASSGSSVASMSITTEDAFAAAVASVSPVALMAVYTDDAAVSGIAQGQVTGVYPDPATVLAGVTYGPSGSDYTGTLAWSSAADIATAVLLRFQATTIPVNLTQVRGQTIGGSGTANDPWGP